MLLKSRSASSPQHQPTPAVGRQQGQRCSGRGQGPERGTSPREGGQASERGTLPGQTSPGAQHGALSPRAPAAPGRAMVPISLGQTRAPRGSWSLWDGLEQGFGTAVAAQGPEGLREDPQCGHGAAAGPTFTLGCPGVWYPPLSVTAGPFSPIPLVQPPLGTATLSCLAATTPQTLSPAP